MSAADALNAARNSLTRPAQVAPAGGSRAGSTQASSGGRPNKGRGNKFRRDVIDELHRVGLVNAHRPIEHKGLTLSERLRRNHGDIIGLPWTLGVSAAQTLDLSGMQHEVRAQAERGGCEFYAAIHRRKNHPTTGAYVVLPLSTFIEVLRRLHPEELLSAQVRAGSSG